MYKITDILPLRFLPTTLICLMNATIFALIGAPGRLAISVFAISALAEIAILSSQQKSPKVALSIYSSLLTGALAGAIVGLVYNQAGIVIFALAAGIISWSKKTALQHQVATISSSIFLVMTYLPWTWGHLAYLAIGGLLIQVSATAQRYAAHQFLKDVGYTLPHQILQERLSAIILPVAIMTSWATALAITKHSDLTHIFWAPLATVMIYRGSLDATWQITFKRIWISIFVALVAVASYGIITRYGMIFSMAILYLNAWATMAQQPASTPFQLLLELFIIGYCLMQLGGDPIIAYERIVFTLIGSFAALCAAIIGSQIAKYYRNSN